MNSKQLLEWYQAMGVDEVIEEEPINRKNITPKTKKIEPMKATKSQPPIATPANTPSMVSPNESKLLTTKLADECKTREQLETKVREFKGLAITKTATNTVFCDGNPAAKVMMIGEAPGAEEDAKGIPFCGASGKILDQMFSHIGLTRADNFYITNTIFWRPPGNRKPTPEELAICQPFVHKHIALIKPELIILVGGTAVASVLQEKKGITKLRGNFIDHTNPYLDSPIPTAPIFHPSYLLRSPGQKRLAWQDALTIKEYLVGKGVYLL